MEVPVNSIAETLPTEILEKIFSYSAHEDVVLSIQNVCSRWRQVAQNSCLWEHLEYCPKRVADCKKIVEILKISPKLQKLIIEGGDGSVLRAITENCAELRKLGLSYLHLNEYFMENLQKKCKKIEHLSIGDEVSNFCVYKLGNFTNLKVLIVTGSLGTRAPIKLRPIGDCKKLEHFEFWGYNFEMKDLRYLLFMRKDTLHTLGVCCCSPYGECVLPAVATCKLKSLKLFDYKRCRSHDEKVKHFRCLKTVTALIIEDLCYENSEWIKKIFENGNMSQLSDLRLYISIYFGHFLIDVFVNKCSVLDTLALDHYKAITDASLKTLHHFNELNLTISGTDVVTNNAAIFHLQGMPNLKRLRIAIYLKNSKKGFEIMARLGTLHELKLWRQDLAEFPWNLIPLEMKYLRCLGIYFCRNVDTCAVEKLKRQLPALNVCYEESENEENTLKSDFRWDEEF